MLLKILKYGKKTKNILVCLANKYLKETGRLLRIGKGSISKAKEKDRNFCKEKEIEE
jgi:hypothetical protein